MVTLVLIVGCVVVGIAMAHRKDEIAWVGLVGLTIPLTVVMSHISPTTQSVTHRHEITHMGVTSKPGPEVVYILHDSSFSEMRTKKIDDNVSIRLSPNTTEHVEIITYTRKSSFRNLWTLAKPPQDKYIFHLIAL